MFISLASSSSSLNCSNLFLLVLLPACLTFNISISQTRCELVTVSIYIFIYWMVVLVPVLLLTTLFSISLIQWCDVNSSYWFLFQSISMCSASSLWIITYIFSIFFSPFRFWLVLFYNDYLFFLIFVCHFHQAHTHIRLIIACMWERKKRKLLFLACIGKKNKEKQFVQSV